MQSHNCDTFLRRVIVLMSVVVRMQHLLMQTLQLLPLLSSDSFRSVLQTLLFLLY